MRKRVAHRALHFSKLRAVTRRFFTLLRNVVAAESVCVFQNHATEAQVTAGQDLCASDSGPDEPQVEGRPGMACNTATTGQSSQPESHSQTAIRTPRAFLILIFMRGIASDSTECVI